MTNQKETKVVTGVVRLSYSCNDNEVIFKAKMASPEDALPISS